MIEFPGLVAGAALLLLLMVVATQGWRASRDLHEPQLARSEEDITERCPEEFVLRIFSRADWDFVRGIRCAGIERLYERERRRVALVWVRQTSAVIRRVMRGHAEAARQSKNLQVSVEINILTQYLALMAVCAILSMAIQIVGPLRLGGLAHFAQRLSLRVAQLQESLQADVLAKAAGQRAV
jgi:hypothetical protein